MSHDIYNYVDKAVSMRVLDPLVVIQVHICLLKLYVSFD